MSTFANVLKSLGVTKGDRVAIYLPLIPELAIAMLACARIGAVHSVVFGGFSAESLRDRINDQQARLLVTADGGYRRGQVVPLKRVADEALREAPSIEHVIVVQRRAQPVRRGAHRRARPLVSRPDAGAPRTSASPRPMDAEDMLYILYTSGTTGKPKGIVHTTGGYLVGTYATTKWVFDLKEDDVYWCTADIGWVTGHSYVVYGPLANGATVVMYEGAPDFPQKDRFWEIIERYGVTIFYTAPTAIRAFMKWGAEWPREARPLDAAAARLGRRADQPRSVGLVSPAHRPRALPDRRHVVADRDGAHHDHAAARHHAARSPARRRGRSPASPPRSSTTTGETVDVGGGLLALTRPWPAMLRGIYGDPERYVQQYWSRWAPDVYFTGDGAKRDEDGYFWLLGRVDDVLNVAGHRIGTMEVESALVDHPRVAEAAVVGRTHENQGPGRRRVRHAARRASTPSERAGRRAAGSTSRKKIGAIAQARRHHLRGRPAEDALGQDHAAPAARHRRRQGARRHDDAGGSGGRGRC